MRSLTCEAVWGQHAALVTVAVEGAVCVDADVAAAGQEDVAAFVDVDALSVVVVEDVSQGTCTIKRADGVDATMAAWRDGQAAFVNVNTCCVVVCDLIAGRAFAVE